MREEEQNVEPTMREAKQPMLQIFHHPIEDEGSPLKVAGFGWQHEDNFFFAHYDDLKVSQS